MLPPARLGPKALEVGGNGWPKKAVRGKGLYSSETHLPEMLGDTTHPYCAGKPTERTTGEVDFFPSICNLMEKANPNGRVVVVVTARDSQGKGNWANTKESNNLPQILHHSAKPRVVWKGKGRAAVESSCCAIVSTLRLFFVIHSSRAPRGRGAEGKRENVFGVLSMDNARSRDTADVMRLAMFHART